MAFPEREYVALGEMLDIVARQSDEIDLAIMNCLSYMSRARVVCANGQGFDRDMPIKLLTFCPPTGPKIPKCEVVGYAPIQREIKN